MAKRWTEREDLFIVEFFDVIGPSIGPRDLGRTEGSVRGRAKKLRESGAWEAYRTSLFHRARALILAGHGIGNDFVESEMEDKAPIFSISDSGDE